jgi:hypothetical protein
MDKPAIMFQDPGRRRCKWVVDILFFLWSLTIGKGGRMSKAEPRLPFLYLLLSRLRQVGLLRTRVCLSAFSQLTSSHHQGLTITDVSSDFTRIYLLVQETNWVTAYIWSQSCVFFDSLLSGESSHLLDPSPVFNTVAFFWLYLLGWNWFDTITRQELEIHIY